MTRNEVGRVAAYAAQIWRNFRVTAEELDVWLDMLGDLDARAVLATLQVMALDNREFAPTPGQIRAQLYKTGAPEVDMAWGLVMAQVHAVGYVGEPKFEHPAVADAVRNLGWKEICKSDEMIIRAHFYKTYPTTVDRFVRHVATPPAVREILRRAASEIIGREVPPLTPGEPRHWLGGMDFEGES